MNPPFVAVSDLDTDQRDHVDRILGPLRKGRPDLSMAFILLAVTRLRPGGVLGCLFPSSLVELQSADLWRRALLERAQLKFLATLGDHGLFAYALVQIAAAVFRKEQPHHDDLLLTLWTSNDKEVTGEALRGLRSAPIGNPAGVEDHTTWRLAWVPAEQVRSAPSWRMRSPRADRLVLEVAETTLTNVSDLFNVRQGILTGYNRVFLIDADEWSRLPDDERVFFKPAIMNRSIVDGRLEILDYVFYPYRKGASAFLKEAELEQSVPEYFRRTLAPCKAELSRRPAITRRNNAAWWELAERRPWIDRDEPRIISKYFGNVGSFVADGEAHYAPVQGYAWFPKGPLPDGASFLHAYAALLNSRVFIRLLENFAPKVAGGQFNLSARYVDPVPLPDLPQLHANGARAPAIAALEALGRSDHGIDRQWLEAADAAVAELYGIPLEFWR